MMMLQRKLLVVYNADTKYLPEGMTEKKTYAVIGYMIKIVKDKDKDRHDLYYVIIGNENRTVIVSSWNVRTYIDTAGEPNFDRISELMRNLTLLGKVLCEKMAKFPDADGNRPGDPQTGEVRQNG